jgi:hypothetical protein
MSTIHRSTFTAQPSTFNLHRFNLHRATSFTAQRSTLTAQRSTFNVQPSTFNLHRFNLHRATFNVQR